MTRFLPGRTLQHPLAQTSAASVDGQAGHRRVFRILYLTLLISHTSCVTVLAVNLVPSEMTVTRATTNHRTISQAARGGIHR
jgi:hypothetical protein